MNFINDNRRGSSNQICKITGINVSLVLLVICFFLNVDLGFAQTATDKQIKSVQKELKRFKKDWQHKLPADSNFDIKQLSKWLNLEYTGFEKVKIAVEAEDWDTVEQELLYYFKHVKKYQVPTVTKLSEKEKEASESALNHYFRGNKDAHPLVFRGGNIDWIGPAFHDGKEIKDREWAFQFQRLLWWEALAKAYHLSGDDKYFYEWQYELVDLAEDILPVEDDDPWYLVRGMETYFRCQRLTNVLPYFIKEELFDAKTLVYFLSSFYLNAEHVRTVYSEKGNHLLGELVTVFENGINFPEFKKSKEWTNDALTVIPKRMFIEIYPDGMNNELIFSYHSMYLSIFADAYVKFKEYGYEKYLPTDFYERLVKMAEVYVYQMFPDNTISQFGDSWKHRNAAEIFRKQVSKYAPELPYFDFIASQGKYGNPPAKTSVDYPLSGFYFFRSAWTPDAVFLSMKNNPNYSWHSQIDNQSFELYAYGRNFMIDSGSYIYESDDPKEAKWREWFKSTVAHQTITLNNENIKIASKHILWKDTTNLTCLVNENQSYDNLVHRRTTLFIDKKYFLIYDQAIGNAEGQVRSHFHLVPCKHRMDEKTLTVATEFDKGANLIIRNFSTENNIKLEKEEGWISYDILRKEQRPAWSYCSEKKSSDPELTFLTALVPYKKNQKPDNIEASVTKNNGELSFTLIINDKTYKILLNAKKGVVRMNIL
ncbi:alginate lyase family protein [Puteibacter caeruleilacunae]|nr:alginate lyase family protein [Puteibacter caeruleilacunae]